MLCLFIALLVPFWLLSGHILENSCPLGWPFVLIVFCLSVFYLFPVLVLRAGFWLLIVPVPVHCFSITLTQENGDACIEIQRRRYDELSSKMCTNSVWREKRRE